ncbi:MAG: hypothetical protein Q4A48_02640, partial [Bacillota bacterium]|nr:hypothetical protein [Bacillota bacterium]
MISTILDNIIWDEFETDIREKAAVDLKGAALTKSGRGLTITLGLNFVMPYSCCEKICEAVREKITSDGNIAGIEEVSLEFVYGPLVQSEEEACRAYVEHMIMMANGDYAAVTKTIMPEHTVVTDDEIRISAVGRLSVDRLNKEVASLFERMLEELPVTGRKVVFVNDTESWDETRQSLE